MAEFAGYGFNKSHSCAYALLAYQTAWLKTHYPVEFMAAMLTSETGNTEKVVKYINEARSMGITVLPPDVNSSDVNFTPVGDQIRFGLRGDQERRREHREGNSGGARDARAIHELFRILRIRGYAAAEQARAGKPDSRGRAGWAGRASRADDRGDRPRDGARAEIAARAGKRPARPVRRRLGGAALQRRRKFCRKWRSGPSTNCSPPNMPRSAFTFPGIRSINMPAGLKDLKAVELSTMEGRRNNEDIVVAGIIVQSRPMRSRRGARWAILTLQDRTGVIEALVFPEAFQKLEPILKPATPLLVKGRVAVEDVGTRVIVSDARLLDQVRRPSAEPAARAPGALRAVDQRTRIDRLQRTFFEPSGALPRCVRTGEGRWHGSDARSFERGAGR